MKTGILGGTFDPPHMAHLIIAEHVRNRFGLDRILFIPSALPPHKLERAVSDFRHRFAMLSLAVDGNREFQVCDIEERRAGISYTVDTLRELKELYPDDSFTLLIGSDNLLEFHLWRDPVKILEMADVVAMIRPGFPVPDGPSAGREKIVLCPVPQIGIASSEIREKRRRGESIRYLVPAAVESYIIEHGLYMENRARSDNAH